MPAEYRKVGAWLCLKEWPFAGNSVMVGGGIVVVHGGNGKWDVATFGGGTPIRGRPEP